MVLNFLQVEVEVAGATGFSHVSDGKSKYEPLAPVQNRSLAHALYQLVTMVASSGMFAICHALDSPEASRQVGYRRYSPMLWSHS